MNPKNLAYEQPGKTISMVFATEVTDAQRYYGVSHDGTNPFGGVIADGSKPVVGFVQRPGRAGEVLPVMTSGITFAIAAGAIVAGSPVKIAATGKIETATGKSDGQYVGIAMCAAGKDGDIVSVQIQL